MMSISVYCWLYIWCSTALLCVQNLVHFSYKVRFEWASRVWVQLLLCIKMEEEFVHQLLCDCCCLFICNWVLLYLPGKTVSSNKDVWIKPSPQYVVGPSIVNMIMLHSKVSFMWFSAPWGIDPSFTPLNVMLLTTLEPMLYCELGFSHLSPHAIWPKMSKALLALGSQHGWFSGVLFPTGWVSF